MALIEVTTWRAGRSAVALAKKLTSALTRSDLLSAVHMCELQLDLVTRHGSACVRWRRSCSTRVSPCSRPWPARSCGYSKTTAAISRRNAGGSARHLIVTLRPHLLGATGLAAWP